MAEKRVQRRLAAILAADVVGYSRLIEADEEGTRARLKRLHSELIEPRIAADGGRIVTTTGDGILAEFPSAVDAVRNALAVQSAIRRHDADQPDERRIAFRVGINLGDVIIEGDDIHGDGVNVAARLEGLCAPGEVTVSASVFDQVGGKLDASFDDLGEHTVKNISRPIRVYRARAEADAAAEPAAAEGPLPLPDKPSIAVLPFQNLSGDPEQEYFADGISEDIITALSHFPWFFVIARNTTFTYKGQPVDVQAVAKELGVRYVLEGSVRKSGDRVRITTQLIEGVSGNHLWAERFDRELDDIFAVQDEITESVANAVAPELLAAEMRQARRRNTPNLDTWTQVMRAHSLINTYSPGDNATATILLNEAIAADPQSCIAHADLAMAQLWAGLYGWSEDTRAAYSAATRSAEAAVDLDGRDAWARTALGWNRMISRQHEEAIRELELAVEINPNLAIAHSVLGQAHAFSGDSVLGLEQTQFAIHLSPRDPLLGVMYAGCGIAYFSAGDYEGGVKWSGQAGQHRPPFNAAYRMVAAALGNLGRIDEARDAAQKFIAHSPGATVTASVRQMPWKLPEHQQALADGLRKAGLPE